MRVQLGKLAKQVFLLLRLALGLGGAAVFLAILWWSRHLGFSSDPLTYTYVEIVGSLLSFTFAASALVRFRGTHDRIPLILAFGFILSGLIETGAMFGLYGTLAASVQMWIPVTWMASRLLLAILLLVVLALDRRLSNARKPGREIVSAVLLLGVVGYLLCAAVVGAPVAPSIHRAAVVARPWDLFPAGLFLVAALGFRQRVRRAGSTFDRALCWAAWLNVACHLAASQSGRFLDAPFTLAHTLKVASYALVLGGALLDNARLFDQVQRLAISDPLTGLANYRRLLSALEGEVQRSRRTGRPFALLLFDLDGLKTINDRHGHLTGSRALCRLGNTLRVHSRIVDTAARYGGDEFAVVLPEASTEAASRVAHRICQRLAADGEKPPLSVSFGAAGFPQDGDTIEKLLGAADRELYRMKGRGSEVLTLTRIAACL